MKKADTKDIKDALQLEREIYELTRGKSLVCPSGKRSHTKANVLKQASMSGTLGVCIKCGKPLIPPTLRTRRSWIDLSTEVIEIDGGALIRADGTGKEPEEEIAALAAHLVHREGVDLARIEAAVDRGDLEAKWSRQCAIIRQQRDFVGILYHEDAPGRQGHASPRPVATPATAPLAGAEADLHNHLCKMNPAQFETWVFSLSLPTHELPPESAPLGARAVAAIRFLRARDRIEEGRATAGLPSSPRTGGPISIDTMNVGNGGVGFVLGGGNNNV